MTATPDNSDALRDEGFISDVVGTVREVLEHEDIQQYVSDGLFTVQHIGSMAAFLEIKDGGRPKHYFGATRAVGQQVAKSLGFNNDLA